MEIFLLNYIFLPKTHFLLPALLIADFFYIAESRHLPTPVFLKNNFQMHLIHKFLFSTLYTGRTNPNLKSLILSIYSQSPPLPYLSQNQLARLRGRRIIEAELRGNS